MTNTNNQYFNKLLYLLLSKEKLALDMIINAFVKQQRNHINDIEMMNAINIISKVSENLSALPLSLH